MIWSTMKTYILEGLLKDSAGEDQRYEDSQLLAYARWACVELSQHTAQATSTIITGDGVNNVFTLPVDMVDTIEKAGLVGVKESSKTSYLAPFRLLPGVTWDTSSTEQTYWEWPTGKLTLSFVPKADQQIALYYFRIWEAPTNDNSELPFPQWMEFPFAYMIAGLAMSPLAAQAANVRQWNRKVDSGIPEHNPAQKQADWFFNQAYRVLNRIAPQDRETFYKIDPRF